MAKNLTDDHVLGERSHCRRLQRFVVESVRVLCDEEGSYMNTIIIIITIITIITTTIIIIIIRGNAFYLQTKKTISVF